jgi:glycosyltransferase involved in cell wall biosynthesis
MKLSVIIPYHNYRDFVGGAIQSALAVDWPDKEVIVVDDASTDDSRSIIEGFGARVAAYFRPKSHQLGTHMFGFEQSVGDVIIFLNADDLLEPEVMQEVAKVWYPGVSKVQYRMNLINSTGAQLGTAIPQFPPRDDPVKLRRAYQRTMAYTTPPGSGSLYSRSLVRKAFSMATSTMRWSDDVLLTLAPLLGDVLTIRKPLVRFRIHSANNTALAQSLDPGKISSQIKQDVEKVRVLLKVTRELRLPVPHDPLRYNLNHLQYRLASYLAEASAHPFPEDTMPALGYRLVASASMSSQMHLRDRMLLVAWTFACLLAPPEFRKSFVLWRFAPMSRPRGHQGASRGTELPPVASPSRPGMNRAGNEEVLHGRATRTER